MYPFASRSVRTAEPRPELQPLHDRARENGVVRHERIDSRVEHEIAADRSCFHALIHERRILPGEFRARPNLPSQRPIGSPPDALPIRIGFEEWMGAALNQPACPEVGREAVRKLLLKFDARTLVSAPAERDDDPLSRVSVTRDRDSRTVCEPIAVFRIQDRGEHHVQRPSPDTERDSRPMTARREGRVWADRSEPARHRPESAR